MNDGTKVLLSVFTVLGWGVAAVFMVSGGGHTSSYSIGM
jgi:hypothetical protein